MPTSEQSAAPDPQEMLQELSNDLMSPFCPGRTISSCPSKAARQLEDKILQDAKAGKSREEIEAQLVAEYGPQIVGYAPRPVVMYGTAIVAIAALVLVAWFGRRWVRKREVPASQPNSGGATREELDALDDALDEEDAF
jgi:cytochrome c-type biogenesis protein CcmH/NrfF